MIYFGVDLNVYCFKVTALSEGFAFLGTKNFNVKASEEFYIWVDSLKCKDSEKCSWFFENLDFNNYDTSIFHFNDDCNNIYLVNYHRFRNFIQFCNEWIIHKKAYFALDIDPAYVLASANRLFESSEIKCYKHNAEFIFW